MIYLNIKRKCSHIEKIGFCDLIDDENYHKNKTESENEVCLPCLIKLLKRRLDEIIRTGINPGLKRL